jgi:hypothetical protein
MEEKIDDRASRVEIQARLENRLAETRGELFSVRSKVSEFFQTRYEDYDFPDEFEINTDEINELLESIGASILQKAFEGTLTLEISFKVRADSREDAEIEIENYISDWGYDSDEITLSTDTTHIEFNN